MSVPQPQHKRVKTPTLLQMEAVECGAASLGIILGYYERYVPLEELRSACGVSRDGCKLSFIRGAAVNYGLEAKAYAYSPEKLRTEVQYPCMIWWLNNHFLVLEGFSEDTVYLNDPASGPWQCPWPEFRECYSGTVLTAAPSDTFEPGGDPPSLLAGLSLRMRDYRMAALYFMVAALFLVIPGLAVPAFTQIFIDEIIVSGRDLWLRPLMVAMGLTMLLTMGITYLQEYYLLRYQSLLALSDSSRFFYHILRLPTVFFSQRFGGEVGRRVQINDKVAEMVAEKLSHMVVDLIKVLFFGALMFFYSVFLGAATILLGIVNFAVIKIVTRKRVDNSRRLQKDEGKLVGTAMGGLQMMETVKGTGGEDEFFQRWAGYQAKTLTAKQNLGLLSRCCEALPSLVNGLTTVVILGVGGLEVMNGQLTVGMLVAFQTVAAQFTKPFSAIVNVTGQMQELQGDMSRVDDVMEHHRDPVYETRDIVEIDRVKLAGLLELKDITFGYNPKGSPLLKDFNLTVKPGQRVALVGGSGSGKSTVARIIAGLYQPWEGDVYFDGVPRSRIAPSLLNTSVSVVDQDIFLFEGSVRENLSMWDATMPEPAMMHALRDACILDVISSRPGGLQSRVDEGGRNFSGGERQRLEIARALVGNPTFLMLDEATSALDPPVEKQIEGNLLRRGCSCLIVAHRLTTVRDCDEIIVMEMGKVVERGTHDELMERRGSYFRLIQE